MVNAPAIAVSGLSKHFAGKAAVNAIDLSIHHGEIYGFL
jgi:ABC-type multidrug transport system ATPase subunit